MADIEGEDGGEGGFKSHRSSTYDCQSVEMGMGHRAPLVPLKRLPDISPVTTEPKKLPPKITSA